VLLDAPDGGTRHDALSAIRNGDIAAVGAVITAGEPRLVGRSRNTPATTRNIRVASCKVMRDFSGARPDRVPRASIDGHFVPAAKWSS
jgi:enamidase